MLELKLVPWESASSEPGKTRCTIGSKTAAGRSGTCSRETVPIFSSEDETVETSSLDLIAPANLAVDAVSRCTPITLRTQITQHYYAGLTGVWSACRGYVVGCP